MILSQWIDEIKTINLRYISFYESYTHPSFSRFRKTLQIFIDITMKYFGSAPNKIWIVAELKLRDVNNSCCWQEQKMMMRARTLALEIWELRSNEFKWLWKVGGNEKSCYLCWTISSTRHQSVILSKIHYKSDCWGKKSPLAREYNPQLCFHDIKQDNCNPDMDHILCRHSYLSSWMLIPVGLGFIDIISMWMVSSSR